ncbi:MAG: c-type cytochrome biogenesis protein CcmI, partial [Betaproteobacteria bacterium RBG_16_64_9]
MTAFLAVAAVMMAGALAAVLPPLLARRRAETSDRGAANIALLRQALEDNDAELRAGTI